MTDHDRSEMSWSARGGGAAPVAAGGLAELGAEAAARREPHAREAHARGGGADRLRPAGGAGGRGGRGDGRTGPRGPPPAGSPMPGKPMPGGGALIACDRLVRIYS